MPTEEELAKQIAALNEALEAEKTANKGIRKDLTELRNEKRDAERDALAEQNRFKDLADQLQKDVQAKETEIANLAKTVETTKQQAAVKDVLGRLNAHDFVADLVKLDDGDTDVQIEAKVQALIAKHGDTLVRSTPAADSQQREQVEGQQEEQEAQEQVQGTSTGIDRGSPAPAGRISEADIARMSLDEINAAIDAGKLDHMPI